MNTNNSPPTLPIWLTKEQIAERFKCSIRTVTNLSRRKILPYYRLGRLIRYRAEECDEALSKVRSASILDCL